MVCVLGDIQPAGGIALRMYFRLWNHTFTEVSQSKNFFFTQNSYVCHSKIDVILVTIVK